MARMASGLGPMKAMPASAQASAKAAVLGQEAVARVNGLGTGSLRSVDDLRDVEVRLPRLRRPEEDRLVGVADMQPAPIRLAVDRDGLDPHLVTGSDDPHRDLAAVRDQNLVEEAFLLSAHAQLLGGRSLAPPGQRGMFPCFLGGFSSFLFSRRRRASTRRGRV